MKIGARVRAVRNDNGASVLAPGRIVARSEMKPRGEAISVLFDDGRTGSYIGGAIADYVLEGDGS